MNWREIESGHIASEEVAGVRVEIVTRLADAFLVVRYVVVRYDSDGAHGPSAGRVYSTIGGAKRAALALMRFAVAAARDEAHNAVLDADLWLHANGGKR